MREQTTIRLPAELMEQLRREAQERGVSFNDYLLVLIHKARKELWFYRVVIRNLRYKRAKRVRFPLRLNAAQHRRDSVSFHKYRLESAMWIAVYPLPWYSLRFHIDFILIIKRNRNNIKIHIDISEFTWYYIHSEFTMKGETMQMARIMTVRPPDELFEELTARSKELGITRNALILQILWDWAKKQTS